MIVIYENINSVEYEKLYVKTIDHVDTRWKYHPFLCFEVYFVSPLLFRKVYLTEVVMNFICYEVSRTAF
jgi:hypothetical protein